MQEFPTVSSDPAFPEEDVTEGDLAVSDAGYHSALGESAFNESAEFVGLSAPVTPEEIEIQRKKDFLAQPVPTDEEAGQLYQRLPFMDDTERPNALTRLSRYGLDLEEKEAQARTVERQEAFLNPEARTEWLNRKDVRENLGYLADSNVAYDRHAVRKFLEQTIFKRQLSDTEYEAARNDFVGRRMAGKPKISDAEAFSTIAKEVEVEKEFTESLHFVQAEMAFQKVDAAMNNRPFRKGDVWDAARKKFPESSAKREAQLYKAVEEEHVNSEIQWGKHSGAIGVFGNYLVKSMGGVGSGGPTPEDVQAVVEAAKSVPPEDLQAALMRAAAGIQHKQLDKTLIQKGWHNLQRDIRLLWGVKQPVKNVGYAAQMDAINNRQKALDSDTVRINDKGELIWAPQAPQQGYRTQEPGAEQEGLHKLDADQKALAAKDLADQRSLATINTTIEQVFESTLGARESYFSKDYLGGVPKFVEDNFYGAREQVPQMLLASLSTPVYFATIGSGSFREIMIENPNMNVDVAFGMAVTEAGINWITDRTQLKGLQGVGAVRKVLTQMRRIPMGKTMSRLAGTTVFETGTEWAQDWLSEAGKKGVQELIQTINPNASVGQIKTFNQINDEFVKNMGPTAMQMFFLSGIASGTLTYRDLRDPNKDAYHTDKLRSAGILEDDITALQFETDFRERDRRLIELMFERTPEQINTGTLYSQKLAEDIKAKVVGPTVAPGEEGAAPAETFKEPRLVPHLQPDGTRMFSLLDGNGTVVQENMDEGVAAQEYAALYAEAVNEHRQKQVEAEAAEATMVRNTAAEAKWSILDAEERTTAGNILEFEYVEQSTEQQRTVSQLRKALAAGGKPGSDAVIVSVDNPATRAGLGAVNFIRWFERTFGKQVVFVASETGQPLGFDGVVNPADPNKIFLNASGNRNVLALLGHEWSHTLESTNKALWNEVMARMKPMVVDWAKQTGRITGKDYTADQADSEFVANIIGDAFSDPEFWRTVRERHSGLFERLIASIQEWFDTIITRVSEWGTESPDVIRDLKGMRNLIAEAIERAREPAETAAPVPGEPTEITQAMIAGLKAIGFDDAQIAGLTPIQAAYYLEPPVAQLSVRVHHGTKTKGIAQWLLDKIGQGEGHAMAGWGIYIAENPGVARRYRELLSEPERIEMVGNEVYDPLNPTHIIAEWLFQYDEETLGRTKAVDRALAAERHLVNAKPSAQKTAYQLLVAAERDYTTHKLPSYRRESRPGGELYTLDMDIARGQALDLDRRMNDQSPAVQKILEDSGIDYAPEDTGWEFQDMMDQRYQDEMRKEGWKPDPNKDQKGAKQWEFEYKRRTSMWLKSIGIPANTFADNFSRKQWQSALRDYYEALNDIDTDISNLHRYAGMDVSAMIAEEEAKTQKLKDDLISDEKRMRTTRNWVLWEPERLKDAPEGERLKFAVSREEAGHKFGTRGKRSVDENGGYVTEEEFVKVDQSLNEQLDKKGKKGAERKRLFEKAREIVLADIRSTRAQNPDASTGNPDPWDTLVFSGVKVEAKGEDNFKPSANWKKPGYRFDEVPDGMTKDQWRNHLAGKVMSQFIERLQQGSRPDATPEQRAGAELIIREIEWYRDFVTRLRQDFGGAADFMADLLGAYSPRQNVELNVRNALDTIWAISQGKYDTLLRDLDVYMKADPAHTIDSWRKVDPRVMTARSGALFGVNTNNGMMAALGLWREIRAGDAPKAKNFTRNLIALSVRATIDVWAARLLDRVAGKPRIPVDAEGAVAGRHLTPAEVRKRYGENVPELIPVEGQFKFGQEIFAQVAYMMRDPVTWQGTGLSQKIVDAFKEVTPADVQAMNWFVEKEIWTERNWTNDAGAGGSFMHEIEQQFGTRFQVGLTQQVGDVWPQDPEQAKFIADVHADLTAIMPEALALRVMDSIGMYKGDRERSLDLELTHGPGLEPNDLMRVILTHASAKKQKNAHVSRVKEEWEEKDKNDRPGIEIYLKKGGDISLLDPVIKRLNKRSLNGFTLVVDPRMKMGSGEYLGIRFQYVPEYSGDGKEWAKKAARVEATIDRAIKDLSLIDDVARAKLVFYDTVVFTKGIDYDDTGTFKGALGTSEAGGWRRRYFDYMAQKAVRRDERESLLEAAEHDNVPHREPVAGEGEPRGLAPPGQVDVNTFDRDSRTFSPTPTVPTKELLKRLQVEVSAYAQLLECLNA